MKTKGKASPAQIQKFLKGINYPVSKKDLLTHAKKKRAPEGVISVLNSIPDSEYKRPTDVSKGVGRVA